MKIPVMVQMQRSENGATALCMILGYYRRFVPMEEMRRHCISSRNGSSPEQLSQAAAVYGLETSVETRTAEELREMEKPVIIRWKRQYYAIVKEIEGNIVTVIDPARGEYKLEMQKLEQLFTGTVLTFRKGSAFRPGGKPETLFRLVWERVRPLLRPMVFLFVFTFLCVGVNLLLISIEQGFLDEVLGAVGQEARAYGYAVLGLYLLLVAVFFLFSVLKTWRLNRTSSVVSARSGMELFKKIFRQPLRFYEQYGAFELISRLDNNLTLDNSILKTLVPRVIDLGMSLVYLVFLFLANVPLAAVCLGIVVLSVALSMKVQERSAIASKSMMTSNSQVNAALLNGISMIETIQAAGAERSFYTRWQKDQRRFHASRMSHSRFAAASGLIANLSKNGLQAATLFIGAYFAVHGNFTLGGMALFQGILGKMTASVNNCVTAVDHLQTMRTNIERSNDICRRDTPAPILIPEEERGRTEKLSGLLAAKDICFRYNPGDRLALDHVSIEAEPGQMIAIVGSTGCGKSTLLKVLADLYKAESGEVRYDGRTRGEIPDTVFHSSVSTVDQETVMFEDSIYNNINMWDSTVESYEVLLAARDAQIHERITREPKDYGSVMLENGRNFSGGELQRLELARALAHEPTLLLLDEFTSALDALTEDRAMKALREKGTTCVIVAHRLSTIVDCDRIYVMDRGRIVQAGTHRELYAQEGLYKTLVS